MLVLEHPRIPLVRTPVECLWFQEQAELLSRAIKIAYPEVEIAPANVTKHKLRGKYHGQFTLTSEILLQFPHLYSPIRIRAEIQPHFTFQHSQFKG